MIQKLSAGIALGLGLAAFQLAIAPGALAKDLKVLSEKTVTGFGHVESVAYDPRGKVFYVSDFGPELKSADKDGKGKITKISLDGKILEDGFLPAKGQVLNKPKGIWIRGDRLWVTDIDSVWAFDLKTKEGKKLELPGITFANDPTVMGGALYVSDNRSDQLVRVEPADFLKSKSAPKISVVFKDKSIFPNGLFPGKGGALLMVGLKDKDNPRAIYSMAPGKDPVALTENFGLLDGTLPDAKRRHADYRLEDRFAHSMEQERRHAEACRRLQRPGRFLCRPQRARIFGCGTRSGQR